MPENHNDAIDSETATAETANVEFTEAVAPATEPAPAEAPKAEEAPKVEEAPKA